MTKKKAKKQATQSRGLRIEWEVGDEIPIQYANNVTIERGMHEYILRFFQVLPPQLSSPAPEKEKAAQLPQSVKAKCVAQIVVAIKHFSGIADLCQRMRETPEDKDQK